MRFPLSGIGNRLILSSFSFPCVMVSCPQYVRTINLPECLPMCLKCHVASAKMPIKYGKYNADTKFDICIKDQSSRVHITLNQRVTGSSPVAPTKSLAQSNAWRHGKLVVTVCAPAGTK